MKLIVDLSSHFKLSLGTEHIAVAYLDLALGKNEFPAEKYAVVAVTCLWVAAKFYEIDPNIPFLGDLQKAATTRGCRRLSECTIIDCEQRLLKALDWNLNVTPAAAFVNLLFFQGVVFSSDRLSSGQAPSPTLAEEVHRKAADFLARSLEGTNTSHHPGRNRVRVPAI